MWLSQVLTVSWFNLRNLKERLGSSLATVVGVAGVVLVFVAVLSIASGFQKTLASTGDPTSVIVMRSGSTDEMSSGLSHEETRIVGDGPGVLRNERGALASAELFVIVDAPRRGSDTPANVPLRGVSPTAFEVRGNVEIVAGRRFEAGRNEIIVGAGAAAQFAGFEIGAEHRWGESSWTVVGVFSTGGTVEDSELWCDAKVLQPAYRRGNSYQSVHLRLESPAAFKTFKDSLTRDPRLNVTVLNKAEYHAGNSTALSTMIRVLGGVIGLLMGFGAVFGALNTMYTAVSARTREIATLRALGFGASPVVISVIFESLVLAALGGTVGAALAYVLFNGFQTATLNWQTFSQVAFAFAVTVPLMVGGFVYALFMGLVGGLFPAVRAANLPVATALREL
ncbi:MAG TPA: ABC transporter permease [Thermoanaerobaculia bacterium]|jgi:putative ABC transport system permease protein